MQEGCIRAKPYPNTREADPETNDKEHAPVEDVGEPLYATIPHQSIVE